MRQKIKQEASKSDNSIFKNFEIYCTNKHKNIFIFVARYGITFSTGTLEALDKSENAISFLTVKANVWQFKQHQLLVNENFFTTGKKRYVRWNNKKILLKMANIAGVSLSNMMYKRFEGTYFDSENVVIFEFAKMGWSEKRVLRQESKKLPFLSERSNTNILFLIEFFGKI